MAELRRLQHRGLDESPQADAIHRGAVMAETRRLQHRGLDESPQADAIHRGAVHG